MSGLPTLGVFYDGPDEFAPRAAWALDTMLAPLGRRVALLRDPAAVAPCTLAYAPAPVAGVPTIPCSRAALRLLAADTALPPRSFQPFAGPTGTLVGAFPVDAPEDVGGDEAAADGDEAAAGGDGAAAGFAVPFDLVASAFVLLACWDEHTSPERDRFDRLPYAAGVFAANPALRIEDPAVDGYVAALRALLGRRLAQAGEAPLPAPAWMWGDARFAVALTHDLDRLWRWTPRGFAASGYRAARAAGRRDWPAVRRELGDVRQWLTVHLPQRTDPYWTFPQMLGGEDARAVTSTFFVIASHAHRVDGNQPRAYRRRLPEALASLRKAGREVGLHGNDRDRRGGAALDDDRRTLERRTGAPVRGVRFHYLRCLYHETLPLLDAQGFVYDTSLAFAEHEGFRCGASFPFHPYFLAEERPLALLEVPLALMDTGLQGAQYRSLDAAEAERVACEILARLRSSAGGAALLWHNARFDRRTAQGYDDVYWRLVDWVCVHDGLATSAGDLAARWRAATAGETAGRPPARTDVGDTAAAIAGSGDGTAERTAPRTGTTASVGDGHRPVLRSRAATRVLHLSVVHKPDDPRIYERECRTLAEAGYDVTYLAPGADDKRDAHGVLRAPLPVRGRSTRWMSVAHIVRHLRAYRPDIVHVHDPELLTLFPALRAFVPRLVYDMHEYVPEQVEAKPYIPAAARPHARRAAAVAQRGLAALGDGAVVVVDEQLAALGDKPELRAVLPNYPRLSRFAGAEPLPRLAADPRLKLTYVGSLSRNRGCTLMLDVMERLSPDDAVLYLGGTFASPDIEAEIRARLAAGLDDRVVLLGRVPPAELPAYLSAADVVWAPEVPSAQYARPTVPTKLFEGMAVGTAVLASDLPGRRELVRTEGCGLVVPPGIEGHLGGLRRLLAERGALAEMGARGREAAARRYSWERVEGALIDFYAALCRDLPPAAG